MKKIKQFIDKLASDKKSHVVLGVIINGPVILGSTKIFNMPISNLYISLALSLIPCIFIHWGIEYWQKKTGKGHYDDLDAVAGVSSAFVIVIVCLLTLYLNIKQIN